MINKRKKAKEKEGYTMKGVMITNEQMRVREKYHIK